MMFRDAVPRALLVVLAACAPRPVPPGSAPAVAFEARTWVAVSDVDMVGTAYADGILRPLPGARDTLSIFGPEGAVRAVPAPNSVISWPAVVDITVDGRHAVVVETRGTPTESRLDDVFTDVPDGDRLTVVDLQRAQVVYSGPSGARNPRSVSVHARHGTLAIPCEDGAVELIVLGDDGRPSSSRRLPLPAAWDGVVEAMAWHPDRDVLAVNLGNKAIAFAEVEATSLAPIGKPLELGRWLTAGAFVGDHFIVPDVGWGPSPLSYVRNRRGHLYSVRFDPQGSHARVGEARVGLSPEGFALAPDGDLAVAVNMRRTYLPGGLPTGLFRGRRSSSLSLVAIDAQGGLEAVGPEVALDALLPEDAVFDDTGRALALAGFHGFEADPTTGFVELWRVVTTEDGPELRRTPARWSTARGPHDLAVSRHPPPGGSARGERRE